MAGNVLPRENYLRPMKPGTRLTLALAGTFICLTALLRPEPDDLSSRVLEDKLLWERPIKVLLAGDSRVWEGLAPQEIGPRCLNFGFSGIAFEPGYLSRLDALLESGSTLILGITPHAFTVEAARSNSYLDLAEKPPWSLWTDVHLGYLLRRFQPFDTLEQRRWLGLPGASNPVRRIFHPNGWAETWRDVPVVSTVPEAEKLVFDHNPIRPELEEDLLVRVAAWRAQGIQVVGLSMPGSDEALELEATYSGFEASEFGTRFELAGGHWLELPSAGLTYYDGIHLSRDSARTYSRQLAGKLPVSQRLR